MFKRLEDFGSKLTISNRDPIWTLRMGLGHSLLMAEKLQSRFYCEQVKEPKLDSLWVVHVEDLSHFPVCSPSGCPHRQS